MSTALEEARAALRGTRCWLVGGAVRDELLAAGERTDIDLIVEGDVAGAARALASAAGAVAFPLSDEFGAWRVVARASGWQADIAQLRGEAIEDDLPLRDFTVNAMARPLDGGELIDPLGGAADLAAQRLRLAGPTALADDPLRALRLVRLACELGLEPDGAAREAARIAAPGLERVAAERIFAELRRIVTADRALDGIALAEELGLVATVLPELEALRGVEQNPFHHLDVHGHTLEVLAATIELERDPAAVLGAEHAAELTRLLAEPLADELTRGGGLRFAALLHDVAKPPTRAVTAEGRITFIGHDRLGATMVRELLGRLRASEKLRSHVAALTLHHLRLGFLVHHQPLSRRALYDYLEATGPVAIDVTLLSVADRLATRGARAEEAIERHVELARAMLGPALRWQREGPPQPLVRGDELARALRLERGPRIGEILAELAAAQFAGEIKTPEEAIAHARTMLGA